MGFYDNNPGEKDAFAHAGAIHDGTATDSSSASTATSPGSALTPDTQKLSGLGGAIGAGTTPGDYQSVDPNNDPFYQSVKAGKPLGLMQAQANAGQMAFSQGGAVPDDNDQGMGPDGDADDQGEDPIKSLFAHLRQKMGLTQMAGAIPMKPGTQSPNMPQPMPGPLPPTSNPFGKRTSAPGKLAGDVVPMPNSEGGPGPTTTATPYYMGTKTDPKVAPIPMKTSDAGAIPEDDEEEAA